jgi:CMP-N,N'-diacetyllegionaminic acid synthase
MYRGKRIVAVIPARSGSKRLPGKNLRLLSGMPLISWSIRAARASAYIDKIIVSTDDRRIADVARRHGAQTPFIRPRELASDSASSIAVLLHALQWLSDRGEPFELSMLLQPTSPLRTAADIDNAVRLLFRKKAQAIVSVCAAEHNPRWSNLLPRDLNMRGFLKAVERTPASNVPGRYFRLNGAVYLAFSDFVSENKSFFGTKTYGYVMDRRSSVDIDTIDDLGYAEYLMKTKTRSA